MKKIKLFDPVVTRQEEFVIKQVLKSRFWAYGGGAGKVLEFEQKFNDYTDSKECVAVNNGTSALHLALSLFDIKDKEVIIPSLSFVSTANAVIYNGGKPVFVDIDPNTMCIEESHIQEAITSKTKVVLPVHFGGFPCNLDQIRKLCKKNELKLVEDAAHAAGSSYNNAPIGSHGDAVCFSFHPVKNLAMPTGGAITLNDKNSKNLAKSLKIRRWCGISNRRGVKYDVTELGWNFYMNEFSAAIGIEQLKMLNQMNKKRKKIAKRYHDEIKEIAKMPYNQECSYHLYWIQVKNRDLFMKKMQEKNVETGIHYHPIHRMSFYNKKTSLPVTEEVSQNIVSLPIHPNLDNDDVDKVIKLTNLFC